MVLIVGFALGEITGITAFISSALMIYFGYSYTRRSEQIKIAREFGDRIETSVLELVETSIPHIT